MRKVKQFIKAYTEDYLLIDGTVPSITTGLVKEEMILYNIKEQNMKNIVNSFNNITGKELMINSLISELSYGQKLILTALISLNSTAQKLRFRNFFTSLNSEKKIEIMKMIEEEKNKGKEIIITND